MELLMGNFNQSESNLLSFDFFYSYGYSLIWRKCLSSHLWVVNEPVSLETNIHKASECCGVAYDTFEELADFELPKLDQLRSESYIFSFKKRQ